MKKIICVCVALITMLTSRAASESGQIRKQIGDFLSLSQSERLKPDNYVPFLEYIQTVEPGNKAALEAFAAYRQTHPTAFNAAHPIMQWLLEGNLQPLADQINIRRFGSAAAQSSDESLRAPDQPETFTLLDEYDIAQVDPNELAYLESVDGSQAQVTDTRNSHVVFPMQPQSKVPALLMLSLRAVLHELLKPVNIETYEFRAFLASSDVPANQILEKRAAARSAIAALLVEEARLAHQGLLDKIKLFEEKVRAENFDPNEDEFNRLIQQLRPHGETLTAYEQRREELRQKGLFAPYLEIKNKLAILESEKSFNTYLAGKGIPNFFIENETAKVIFPELLHRLYLETYGHFEVIPQWLYADRYKNLPEYPTKEMLINEPHLVTLTIQNLIDYDMLVISDRSNNVKSPFIINENPVRRMLTIAQNLPLKTTHSHRELEREQEEAKSKREALTRIIKLDISKGLKNIPDLNFDTKLVLSLDDSGFIFSQDAFKDCKRILHLSLKNNFLSSIPENAFNGLDNLQLLDVSNNYIEMIAPGAFSNLRNLRSVDFRGNKISDAERERITAEITKAVPADAAINITW